MSFICRVINPVQELAESNIFLVKIIIFLVKVM
jgi:hypothetical protein